MPTFLLELLTFFLLLHLPSLATAVFRAYSCESKNADTTNNSFNVNMQLLLQSLYSNTTTNGGFFNDTKGLGLDQVYGLAMCTGYVSMADCKSGLNSSIVRIVQTCPNFKAAIIWFDECLLRYSDENFFGKISNNTRVLTNINSVANVTIFNQKLNPMMKGIIKIAAFGPRQLSYPLMFAVNKTSYMNFQTMYGQVQCTRDLSNDNCDACLTNQLDLIPSYSSGSEGASFLSGCCFLRYEVYPFYYPSQPPIAGGKKNTSTTIFVKILVPIGVLVIIFLFYIFWCNKRNKMADYRRPSNIDSLEIMTTDLLIFDLAIIKFVTNNFSELNKLGEGGFGAVYKGTLLNGEEIAVKRLFSHSEQCVQELKNEISLLSKLQHRNLVRILGFCWEEDEKLLIYEYVNNKSLDIILNDFGIARMFEEDQTRAITNRVAGTLGYMPPEYVRRGHFSSKSDVFSFGVLVLEIVTGQMNKRIYDEDDLLTYVWEHWCKRTISDIVDSTIKANCPMNEVLRCIEIGLLCVQEYPEDRISMSTVVVMLSSHSVSFTTPLRPAFLTRPIEVRSSIDEGNRTNFVDVGNHVLRDEHQNELSITELGTR